MLKSLEGSPTTRRSLLSLSALLAASLIAGCGGGTQEGSRSDGNVRLVNLTEQASLELFANGDRIASGTASYASSAYAAADDGSVTLQTRSGGVPTSTASYSLGKGDYYSLLAYTASQSTTKALLLDDNASTPTSGSSKLRVVNATVDAGAVDVYITSANQDLATAVPIHANLGTEQASVFSDLTSGTYRLRVTAANEETKVLLDLPSVTFASQQIVTLALGRTSGGVLVHGLTMLQRGASTAQRNTSVRVRLVAAATGNAAITATMGGVPLSSNLTSPSVGSYVLVPAIATAGNTTISAGGNTVSPGTLPTLSGGEDLTLLVTGAPTAATAHWLNEDNRLPAGTNQAAVRLVHALNNAGTLSMTAGGISVANSLALGSQSAKVAIQSGSNAVQITGPLAGTVLNDNDVSFTANGVYTVFVLGDGAGSASVQMPRSR